MAKNVTFKVKGINSANKTVSATIAKNMEPANDSKDVLDDLIPHFQKLVTYQINKAQVIQEEVINQTTDAAIGSDTWLTDETLVVKYNFNDGKGDRTYRFKYPATPPNADTVGEFVSSMMKTFDTGGAQEAYIETTSDTTIWEGSV